MRIRTFVIDDIPQVVNLRRSIFRRTEQPSAEDACRYFQRIFFENPWIDEDIPSLVYEADNGELVGFLGAVPRPMIFQGHRIRAAATTQLMVHPDHRGLAAFRLLKTLFSGPQELSLSDATTDDVRKLWEKCGGRTRLLPSLNWVYPLRPARFGLAHLRGKLGRFGSVVLRPPALALDAVRTGPAWRRYREGSSGLTVEPAGTEQLAAQYEAILGKRALRPLYDARSLAFLLDELTAKRFLGTTQAVLFRDGDGEYVGWSIYISNPRGISRVVQLAAERIWYWRALQALMYRAWCDGSFALEGRADPSFLSEAPVHGGWLLRHHGAWNVYHTRNADLARAIEAEDVFISRLEGEWWLRF